MIDRSQHTNDHVGCSRHTKLKKAFRSSKARLVTRHGGATPGKSSGMSHCVSPVVVL